MKVLTRKEFVDVCLKEFPEVPASVVDFPDSSYRVVSRTAVFKKFRPFFRRMKAQLNILKWENDFDCNAHANLAAVIARVMHRQGEGDEVESVCAVQVTYNIDADPFKGHRIIAFYTGDEWIYYEAVNDTEKHLSQSERWSAWNLAAA